MSASYSGGSSVDFDVTIGEVSRPTGTHQRAPDVPTITILLFGEADPSHTAADQASQYLPQRASNL
jgi:hypothetical protein